MRRAYPILHIILIAAMLVAAVAMASSSSVESGVALDLATIIAL